MVISYRRFGTTSVPSSRVREVKTSWTLKMAGISCPKTSVWNYHSTPRNIPEERRSQNWVITEQISVLFLHPLNYEPSATTKYSLIAITFSKSLLHFRLSKDFSDLGEEIVDAWALLVNLDNTVYCCTVLYGIYILFTHQQMYFLLNLEKFKFILNYT